MDIFQFNFHMPVVSDVILDKLFNMREVPINAMEADVSNTIVGLLKMGFSVAYV